MSELKSKLPGKPKQQDMDAFILGADTKAETLEIEAPVQEKLSPKTKQTKKIIYPWEEPGIRDDVVKVYNLRLPEAYLLKLKYISEHTPDSMQKFCLHVVQSAIDEKIAGLVK